LNVIIIQQTELTVETNFQTLNGDYINLPQTEADWLEKAQVGFKQSFHWNLFVLLKCLFLNEPRPKEKARRTFSRSIGEDWGRQYGQPSGLGVV
jgi:hypothetical protein